MEACSGLENDAYTFSIALNAGGEVTATQFDLEYDPTAVQVSVSWDGTQASAEKDLSQVVEVGPGLTRVIIIGMNTNALFDGGLVYVRLQPQTELTSCVGLVRMSNTVAASAGGDGIPVTVLVDPGSPGGRSWQQPGPSRRLKETP